MEKLMHYTWRHRLYPLHQLTTTDGRQVEIIDPGLYNRGDGGPDFFNAKVKVDGTVWAGNVEMHKKASDWFRHGHDKDAAYNNVIMHVVEEPDMDALTQSGRMPAMMVLPVPASLKKDYEHLIEEDKYPRCHSRIPDIPPIKLHAWMSALQTERLERKTKDIAKRLDEMGNSWEDAYFRTLARNYGFGINGDAMEMWARTIDLKKAGHHRDDLFQVEAMFIGQANLLDRVEEKYATEYAYLKHKFGLEEMNGAMWRYLRTRPQNFPHVRILQLARMFHERRTSFSDLLDCKTVKEIGEKLDVKGTKLDLIIINTVVPVVFAYGRKIGKEVYCERAFDMLEQLKPESNNIVRLWQECGLESQSAGDSQALIQLKNEYCDKKECLRCRIGYEYFRRTMEA